MSDNDIVRSPFFLSFNVNEKNFSRIEKVIWIVMIEMLILLIDSFDREIMVHVIIETKITNCCVIDNKCILFIHFQSLSSILNSSYNLIPFTEWKTKQEFKPTRRKQIVSLLQIQPYHVFVDYSHSVFPWFHEWDQLLPFQKNLNYLPTLPE